MRALQEKVAPTRREEARSKEDEKAEKKEIERRKVEYTRDAMALQQLVEPIGGGK
jgi:hypothetical protein